RNQPSPDGLRISEHVGTTIANERTRDAVTGIYAAKSSQMETAEIVECGLHQGIDERAGIVVGLRLECKNHVEQSTTFPFAGHQQFAFKSQQVPSVTPQVNQRFPLDCRETVAETL